MCYWARLFRLCSRKKQIWGDKETKVTAKMNARLWAGQLASLSLHWYYAVRILIVPPAPCQCYAVLAIGLSCPGPARCDASKASYCCMSGPARDFSISFYHLPLSIQRRGSDQHSSHLRPAPSSFTQLWLWNHRRSADSDTNNAFGIFIKPCQLQTLHKHETVCSSS